MDDEKDKKESLDYVLDEVGEFGTHQVFHFILLILPIVLSAAHSVEYIVTSATNDHRCYIPECDGKDIPIIYDSKWLPNAIPYKNNRPEKCLRYVRSNSMFTNSSGYCPKTLFNETDIISCDQFIFKTNEHRIMKEFGILCDENEYKLALVGTIKNVGGFLFMPLTGILSDKFGRLSVLAISMFMRSIFSIIKAFCGDYTSFMIFEFLSASVGTCCYMAAYVLCVEWVSSRYRILSSTIITVTYPLGEVLVGITAIYFEHYRTFLLVIYVPALLTIFYFWLVPESVRWLVVTGQYDRADSILKYTAKQNNRHLSDKSIEILNDQCFNARKVETDSKSDTIKSIFQHKQMLIRLFTCSICWIMAAFLYNGLMVNATRIADDDNKYLTYITTMIAEMPAAIITYFLLSYLGRRAAMCSTLIVAGVSIIFAAFIPSNHTVILRTILFIGMCATSSSFSVLYVFSAELWPTKMRNTLMNICSMMGRFGSTFAPLAILLAQIMPSLPLLVFGGIGLLCASIIFLLPETKCEKLPDTIEDACRL